MKDGFTNISLFQNRRLLSIVALLILLFQPKISFGQLTGVKNIPGDYPSVSLAVQDLNFQGIGAGGVTFNIAAGHSEILTNKIILTATGSAANPIVFQKNGAGSNPVLTAYVGTAATPSVLADGFFVLAGSDYVTIDGIDLQESAANTTPTTVMEFGYGLFKASDADGCQNNVIKNCTITLDRLQNTNWTAPGHVGSVGIAVLNALYTATGAVTVIAPSGSNSFNQFYSNTIQNCNAGISFIGYVAASPFDLGDTGNDVGGNSLLTGNTILNFGGGAATNPATGIFANSQWDFNVSYNTINNNNGLGVNHATTMRGIFLNSSSTSASANCNFNTITLTGGALTNDLTFIENAFGSTPAGNTININNNTLTGSYPTATSGAFRGIYNNSATPETLNIQNNTISNLSYSNAAITGSGLIYPIFTSGSNAAMTINASGNMISNITRTGTTGGTTIGLYISAGVNNMSVNVNNNTIQNLSIDGTGTASTLYGIQMVSGTIVCNNNLIDGLSCLKTTGTGAMYGIYNLSSPVDENYNFNIVRNLAHAGTGIVYGMYTNTTTGTRIVSNNLIHSLTTGGTTIAGMNSASSSPTMFQNKIYNIMSTSTGAPVVSGIIQGSLGTAGVSNIYNNFIGDLRAPNASSASAASPSIRALNLTTTSTNTAINISYNTIHLNAASTGANFGTACLYVTGSATATTGNLTLMNNIFANLSTPAGVSNTVAYQRSNTNLANFDVSSNNNLLYAGTPGSQNLIFYDGTNANQSITDYKVDLSPRESMSVTENPPFLSIVGSNANFLHINTAVATQIESGGVNIVGITNDYDNDVRQGNIGYVGSGTAPDLGADEGDFIPTDLSGPNIVYTPISNSICFSNTMLSATITDPSDVNTTAGTKPRLWYKKSTENNVLPATNTSVDNGWKWVEASNASSPFTFTIDNNLLTTPVTYGDVIEYFVVAQDLATVPNVGVNIATFNTGGNATTVSLASNLFPVSNTNSYTILTLPVSENTLVSPNTLCLSGNSNLTLSTTGLAAEYQWESSPASAGIWTAIPGAITESFLATGLNSSTDFRCIISCSSVPVAGISPSTVGTVTVNSPQVLTTTPADTCITSPVSLQLSATKNVGSTLFWYTSPSGGTPIFTGDNFTTPLISSTTTYYVSAGVGSTTGSVGPAVNTIGTISSSNIAIGTQRMYFNVLTDATILSVNIYPTAAIGSNGSIVIRNNTQTVIATIPYTTTVTGGAVQTIPLNVFLPAGTAYEMGQGTAINLNRNTTGASYPYTSSAISITGNSFDVNYYYFFYNWQFSTGCESPRNPVVATISNSFSSGTDTRMECGSYTWIDGNTYTSSNSTATYTYVGGAADGCDSIVTLNLTILPIATGTDIIAACDSYTWIDGITYTASNNSATHTLVAGAANGCDSIVTLNLTINYSNSGTAVITACDSYTWIDGITYTASNNTATFTVLNAGGCDSLVTLDLTINYSSSGTAIITACNSFTWLDGITYTTNNNTATFTLLNSVGCDSIVTLDLTITNSTSGTDIITACGSYTWIDGNIYTASNNTATFTLTNAAGCDSLVTLDLTINAIPVITATDNGDGSITSSTGDLYQWIDCSDNSEITGEVSQTYTATANGSYAVIVTVNGCSDTSDCVLIDYIGIKEIEGSSFVFTVSPNPSNGNFKIQSSKDLEIVIYNSVGQIVLSQNIFTGENNLQIENNIPGMYMINGKDTMGNQFNQRLMIGY